MPAINLNKFNSNRIFIFLSILVAGIFVIQVLKTIQYKNTYGSLDLRNRVIGARIAFHKKDSSPYTYKWQPQDGEHFLDIYDSPSVPVNRNTVTPFLLQLMQPFCDNKFQSIVFGWYIAEVLALLIILRLLLYDVNNWKHRWVLIFIALGITGLSQAWLLHNLNGQVYIFYALLMAVLYYFFNSQRKLSPVINGITLGLLVLVRPVAVVFVFPFLVKKKWRVIGFFLFFISIYFLQQYLANEIWLWKDYYLAMKEWSVQMLRHAITTDYIDIYNVHQLEGSSAIAPSPYQHLSEDSSLAEFLNRFLHIKAGTGLLLLFFFLAVISLILVFRKKITVFTSAQLFVLSFLFYFLAEVSLPAIRNSYNAVQWVVPLLIIFSQPPAPTKRIWLLILGGLFSVGLFKFIPFDLTVAEVIFAAICFTYLNNRPTYA